MAAELNRMNAEYLDQDELARRLEYSGNLEQKKTRLAADVTACEKKLEECRRGLRGLYLDKVKGIYPREIMRNCPKICPPNATGWNARRQKAGKRWKNWKLRPKRTAAAESGPGGT